MSGRCFGDCSSTWCMPYAPRMSFRSMVAIAFLASLLAGCSATSGSSDPSRAMFTFTCCRASDMHRVYHPGDLVTIHWIREAATYGSASGQRIPVTLSAQVDGSFGSPADAKAAYTQGRRVGQARAVHVTSLTTTAPVSRIRIPSGASPGLYNLTTTVADPGSTKSGTGIIRVAQR
jgi:hypothetical protein